MPKDTVTITKEQFCRLMRDSLTLTALENGGVDNWTWIGESMQNFEDELRGQLDIDEDKHFSISEMSFEDLYGQLY